MRHEVYKHVERFIQPNSRILELNAGTGIDALHFVSQGHRVHAIDVAEGMISQIKNKIESHQLHHALTCQRLSYADLGEIQQTDFDFVFSNFGGLNCVEDLSIVTQQVKPLLKKEACI